LARVCMLTPFPATASDSSFIQIVRLVRGLVQQGCEVYIVTTIPGESKPFAGLHLWRPGWAYRRLAQSPWRRAFNLFFLFLGTVRILGRHGIDLIHVQWIWPIGPLGVFMGILLRRPVVLTSRGSDLKIAPHSGLARAGVVMALRNASFVTSVSGDLRKHAISLGARPDHTAVISSGVDLTRFNEHVSGHDVRRRYNLTGFVIGCVGRLEPIKGIQYFVEAAFTILERLPTARFMIIGGGEEESKLREIVSQGGASQSVVFTGEIAHNALNRYVAACDIIVIPSLSEGMPNVLMESIACCKPVVATSVGGIPEVISDGENGLLVPPRNAVKIAEAVLRLAFDDDLRRRFANEACSLRYRFAKETVTRQTYQVYATVLRERGKVSS